MFYEKTFFYNIYNIKIIIALTFTIGSFSNCKDAIPVCLRANIVYSLGCAQSLCTSEYIGPSIVCRTVRACEHMGISFGTKHPIAITPE